MRPHRFAPTTANQDCGAACMPLGADACHHVASGAIHSSHTYLSMHLSRINTSDSRCRCRCRCRCRRPVACPAMFFFSTCRCKTWQQYFLRPSCEKLFCYFSLIFVFLLFCPPPRREQEEHVHCVCGGAGRGNGEGEEGGVMMLDCDRCHRWFHGHCVGIASEVPI